jgi:serine protease Do
VNSQIFSQSGGFQGVSFSIPIDVAAKVARQLRDKGKVSRGWLGVVVQEVDRNLAQSFHMDKPEGALVARVLAGSPAEEAGIKAGDVILTFDGDPIGISSALPPMVGSTDPGQMVELAVIRDGKKIKFRLPVGPLEDDTAEDSGNDPGPPREEPPAEGAAAAPLGLVVTPLTDEQRNAFRVLSGGAVVQDVRPGPALAAGIRAGDVILSIAGQEIDSPDRLAEVAKRLTPGSTVPILVSRNGSPQFLPLDLSRTPSPAN